jgi:hypothetical protein
MGTRSLTVFKEDDGTEIVVLYRQMDGYPSGHGDELAALLRDFAIGNGIPVVGRPPKFANGMGCLAAQVVAHFKCEPGEFYLYPAGTRHVGEEYVYTLQIVDGTLNLECRRAHDGAVLHDGFTATFHGKAIEAREAATQE